MISIARNCVMVIQFHPRRTLKPIDPQMDKETIQQIAAEVVVALTVAEVVTSL